MLRGYRVFRAAVVVVLLAVFATFFIALAIDFGADRGILVGLADSMHNGFYPLDIAESVPGFWPTLLFLVGISGGMWLEPGVKSWSHWAALRTKPRPLEILFDPTDHRFVHQEFANGQQKGTTCVAIAIRNTKSDAPLQDVVVSARRNHLARTLLEPSWGGRMRQIDRIAPKDTEFLALFTLPDTAAAAADVDGLYLVIRARAKDTRKTTARFAFNARPVPRLRRVS